LDTQPVVFNKLNGNWLREDGSVAMRPIHYFNDDNRKGWWEDADPTTKPKQVGGSHYTSMKIQPIEFIVANNLEYRVANVVKYACRHGSKNGREDIDKAIHYLEMIRETDYPTKTVV